MPGERITERLYYYYCIHLRLAISPSWIVNISDQWERKLSAIQAYESQLSPVSGKRSAP